MTSLRQGALLLLLTLLEQGGGQGAYYPGEGGLTSQGGEAKQGVETNPGVESTPGGETSQGGVAQLVLAAPGEGAREYALAFQRNGVISDASLEVGRGERRKAVK